jgi:hypothetical protein
MAVDAIGSATSAAAAAVQATDGDDAKAMTMLKKAIDQDKSTVEALMASLEGSGGRLDIQA